MRLKVIIPISAARSSTAAALLVPIIFSIDLYEITFPARRQWSSSNAAVALLPGSVYWPAALLGISVAGRTAACYPDRSGMESYLNNARKASPGSKQTINQEILVVNYS